MKMHISISYGLVEFLLLIIFLWCTEAMMQQLEVEQLMKQLNKPALKSIKSPDGDIIDCVHISRQPAFDHPLLKNHTIQMRPSFHPLGIYDDNNVASNMETNPIPQLWHENGRCPEDTIPIKRTKIDDVVRARSLERYGKKSHGTIPNPNSAKPNDQFLGEVHEHAVVYTNGDKYYGAKGTLNVWNPMVQKKTEFSLTQLWILAGPTQEINTIEAGWHVAPNLNEDNRTRIFIYWTGDGYQSTGCYNLLCPGFIQVNNDIAFGTVIQPISSYGGIQREIILLIWKDPKTGNWWLQYGDRPPLGYWPSSLFNHLSDSASMIEWGGEIMYGNLSSQHTSTEMGSGHFPGEGFGKASYVRNIQIIDGSQKLRTPQGIDTFNTKPTCYHVHFADNGYNYYGGPGRNPNCP